MGILAIILLIPMFAFPGVSLLQTDLTNPLELVTLISPALIWVIVLAMRAWKPILNTWMTQAIVLVLSFVGPVVLDKLGAINEETPYLITVGWNLLSIVIAELRKGLTSARVAIAS